MSCETGITFSFRVILWLLSWFHWQFKLEQLDPLQIKRGCTVLYEKQGDRLNASVHICSALRHVAEIFVRQSSLR